MNLKKALFWGTIAISSPIILYYSLQKDVKDCKYNIPLKYSKQQIEEIIQEIKTPKEAFYRISKDLVITEEADKLLGCKSGGAPMSMIENYSLGYGDCVEGAIDFKVMLNDNPEYEVKLISINQRNDTVWNKGHKEFPKHLLNIYKYKNKYAIVSFNNVCDDLEYLVKHKNEFNLFENAVIYFDGRYPKGVFNFMTDLKFNSIDEAKIVYNNQINLGGSIKIKEISIPLKRLKFGKEL